ncbi:hypothetical protein OTUT144_2142 [Orientia tsutsugamushi str. UT144]|uniref:Uncharacterized protein n=1 Tax=Orientia tsutsugamushi str. UT144 TaxID=1441384 RepID=A0A0F3RHK2_ORITS|nr:hypothetical protein OTUT144_2142 [Orientia tsutsugamushi str. UT144]
MKKKKRDKVGIKFGDRITRKRSNYMTKKLRGEGCLVCSKCMCFLVH